MTSRAPPERRRPLELNEPFRGGGSAGDSARAAEYLEGVSSHPAVRAYKAVTFGLTLLDAPSSVLDVGCGLGDDVRALLELAPNGTRAVGVEINPDFLAEARRRGTEAGRLDFVASEPEGSLPFGAGEFGAVRSDRVLQHLDEPGALIDEMCRVASPGGRLVLSEPDWVALSISGLDAESQAIVTQLASRSFASPTVARELEAMLEERGLIDVNAQRNSFTITSLDEAQILLSLDELLQGSGAPRAARMLAALAELDRAGQLEVEMVGYIATGRMP